MKLRLTSNNGSWLGAPYQRAQLGVVLPVLLTLCAALLWSIALRKVDLRPMTDLGLVSVLPPAVFVALSVVTISFCISLSLSQLHRPILLLHCAVLALMLYGMPTLVEQVPRFHVAWRHVGIAEYIMRNGYVNTRINAYFSWPGFFILSAFVTAVSGWSSPINLVAWAPVIFNLLYLGPLLLILRSAARGPRTVWLGAWFFYLTNWIGQDYFSPQALNFFFYLVILGILCRWFPATSAPAGRLWQRLRAAGPLARLAPLADRWLAPGEAIGAPIRPPQRLGLMAIVVALALVVAASHQMTPFFTLASVAALVVFNRCSARGLPVLLAVVFVGWLSFMTTGFLSGHIHSLVSNVGELSKAVNTGVIQRVRGSPGHIFVVQLRVVMSLAIGVLALLGGLRRLRNGYRDLSLGLLAVVPFSLMAFQPYGGEMLLRAYLFALPALVFFAAALFFPTPEVRTTWRTTVAISLVSIALLAGFCFTRYGNERMDYYTPDEAGAVQYVYSIAPPGALLLAGSENMPWKYQDVEHYRYGTVTRQIRYGDLEAVADRMRGKKYPAAYLILTRSQPVFAESIRGLPREAWDRFEQALYESDQFRLIYENEDAEVYMLSQGGKRPGV
ncbi:MAG TPA: hypothetical protein VF897_06045 [Roseiflexaceae bacterium]